MSKTDTSKTSQPAPEPEKASCPGCAVSRGSVSFPIERKVMVGLAALCIAVMCVALLWIAFYAHLIAGLFMTAVLAWWLGSSIAETLKQTKDDSSPNIGDQERAKRVSCGPWLDSENKT